MNNDLIAPSFQNSTTGGAGLNRADDWSGNRFRDYEFKGKLRSIPNYLRPRLLVESFGQVFGLGIRIQAAAAPLTVRDFGYTGNSPLDNQPEYDRPEPWFRRIFQ